MKGMALVGRRCQLGLMASMLLAAAAPAGAGWSWVQPLPHGNEIHGLWGFAEDDVYAVGEAGTISHWDGVE